MKLRLAVLALLVTSISAHATITINLGVDKLFQSNGTTPIPTGSLLQLVVSTTDNVFTLPTAGSFVGGSADDIVLASFACQSNGSFGGPIVFSLSGNLNAGDQIMLRWFPTLTISSSSPGAGTSFGQFRTDNIESASNIAWVVPADGSTVSLNFLDIAGGGTEPNSAGTASLVTAAIPEPSSVALAIFGGGALFAALRRCVKV